jgi:hypothetical protein
MKTTLLSLLVVTSLVHTTPPVPPPTHAALQKVDPENKTDH